MHHTVQPTAEQVQAHIPLFEPLVLAALLQIRLASKRANEEPHNSSRGRTCGFA